jgi:hypothetical protein
MLPLLRSTRYTRRQRNNKDSEHCPRLQEQRKAIRDRFDDDGEGRVQHGTASECTTPSESHFVDPQTLAGGVANDARESTSTSDFKVEQSEH